ncbi:uncharacterized protein TNCV_887621 [Trichonephila clavipes]|uniref:Uncharacterized protein n=1 Tax=Trichonephila clavipes TaxID=2585209 RepID=A0A8X6R8G4_TRICX|nr:uncharacterized protein TNCV_887621 [Trichonephila clavipes]
MTGAYLEYTQNIVLQYQGEDPTGAGSLLPPVYSEAWAKGIHRTPFSSLRDAADGKHAGRKTNGVSRTQVCCLDGKRRNVMTRKRVENREGSLGYPGIKRKENMGTFVNNMVQEIRRLTNPEDWKHIPGILNPANLHSRGCGVEELIASGETEELRVVEVLTRSGSFLRPIQRLYPLEVSGTDRSDLPKQIRDTEGPSLSSNTSYRNSKQEIRKLLLGEELGSRKPSELLCNMKRRAESLNVDDKLVMELFLQRLPSSVQTILTGVSDLTLAKAADIADRILEVPPSPIEIFAVSNRNEVIRF